MRYLIGEIERIEPVEGAEVVADDYGFKWQEHIRYIKLIGYREGNRLIYELPENLKDKMIAQRRKLCVSPEYSWHFTTKIGAQRLIITFDEAETKKIEAEGKL